MNDKRPAINWKWPVSNVMCHKRFKFMCCTLCQIRIHCNIDSFPHPVVSRLNIRFKQFENDSKTAADIKKQANTNMETIKMRKQERYRVGEEKFICIYKQNLIKQILKKMKHSVYTAFCIQNARLTWTIAYSI